MLHCLDWCESVKVIIISDRIRTSFGITDLYNFLASVLSVSDMISTAGHEVLLHDMIMILILIWSLVTQCNAASHAIKQTNGHDQLHQSLFTGPMCTIKQTCPSQAASLLRWLWFVWCHYRQTHSRRQTRRIWTKQLHHLENGWRRSLQTYHYHQRSRHGQNKHCLMR